MLQPREREKKRRRAVRQVTGFVRVRARARAQATGTARSCRDASRSLVENEIVDEVNFSLIDLFCRQAPAKAFDYGVDALTKIADTMSSLVEENRIDLDAIEARGEELDRLNEENKQLLAELTAG